MGGFLLAPDSYLLTRWLFLRLLGLIYLIAFASFGVQLKGLIGERGILPAKQYIALIRESLGKRGFWQYPSLAWLNASDGFLLGICVAGILLALALVLGFQTTWVLLLLWAGYLSLVVASQIFLSYQWDVLLVETGFLSVFLIPPSLLPSQTSAPPSPVIIFLFVWLLFKLVFMSGLLKWVGGDPTWRGLTAMRYHYETQPLPTPLAWWVHKFPAWFQKFSIAFALFSEIVVPFLFFLPDPLRPIGAVITILLQILILLTGNFAFFNWLTIFLCVFLLHDSQIAMIESWVQGMAVVPQPGTAYAWGWVIPTLLALIYIPVGLLYILVRAVNLPKWVQRLYPAVEVIQDWRLINSYGLFVSMTTTHPEIILEGSDDGQNWLPYRFRFKIDDPRKPLPLVAPHQPRLDWQMWFAALGDYASAPWFLHFVERLLQSSPPVLALLARNPFPDHPPKYLRGTLYNYTFSSFAERRAEHVKWDRTLLGTYMPIASLQKD